MEENYSCFQEIHPGVGGRASHLQLILKEKKFPKQFINEDIRTPREKERECIGTHTRRWPRLLEKRIESNKQLIHD